MFGQLGMILRVLIRVGFVVEMIWKRFDSSMVYGRNDMGGRVLIKIEWQNGIDYVGNYLRRYCIV